MIPTGSSLKTAQVQAVQQPSRTWHLDFDRGRVSGMVDELDAVRQAVFKILQTERFRYLIYSFNYGHELDGMVGVSPLFVQSEAARIIREALMTDDRIRGVENVSVEINGDAMLINFTVISVFGSFQDSQEVIR
ncbi:DUF2634 domain-containing protein [Paenibacillus hemerocallicola]|uniref:DUF2634 domain-containing protein n=1 Tax=Paenibacillus hemerocallicola TaxID=1172614 RepID=A0A5C4TGH5_9BACL|nr:DUF2634 domain-containing protein [Paenibacillus hemerocallicola]TNJ68234.1 DUF2634 domain-containing protein [Paenibacillus hemerocallicola]